ncbi:MFS transporter [Mangrovactinospora gilvigrisea]|uniref:MFS transporter n=1 Tax=Mangrovactinospora gilvigrisea TaxID=1428644 RepID=A0A1J7C1X8_9ACTN|nr:MFS transporter [Mangrovactinospora gilvigrisea]OIV35576.1 MFS transporter [Mangrovactinospora gilvigrisea]
MSAAAAPAAIRSRRPLVGVLAGLALALTGTRVSAIAIPWFVLVTTGSATRTGLVTLCEMAPYVLVKALSGPVVDRVGARPVSVATDVASALGAAAIVALHGAGLLSTGVLLVLVAVVGGVRGPGDLAKEVMIPAAADAAGVPLERATGMLGVIERLAQTVGPAAAGGLIAAAGAMAGLIVNAAAFALGSVVIALMAPRSAVPHDQQDGAEPGGYLRGLADGWRFLRNDRLLMAIALMICCTNLIDQGRAAVLMPVWARESGGGPAALGAVGTVWGIAAVCGSLTATALAHRMPRRTVYLVSFVIAGPPLFLVLASGAPLWAVASVAAVGGCASGFINPILSAVEYERIPRRMLGRVNALVNSLAWAGIPLGGLAAGAAVAAVGLAPALVAGGGLYFLVTTGAGLRPEWREMDRDRKRPAGARSPDGERLAAGRG